MGFTYLFGVESLDTKCNSIEREKKAHQRWLVKAVHKGIFPYIDEKRFSGLYSDKGLKSNTPSM